MPCASAASRSTRPTTSPLRVAIKGPPAVAGVHGGVGLDEAAPAHSVDRDRARGPADGALRDRERKPERKADGCDLIAELGSVLGHREHVTVDRARGAN